MHKVYKLLVVVRFLSAPGSRRVFYLIGTVRDKRQDIPADLFPSITHPFPRSSLLPRIPPLSTPILWAPSSRSKQGTHNRPYWFNSASKTPMIRGLTLSYHFTFERCNNSCSVADGCSRQHGLLTTINDIIWAVMKKISTCKFCYFGDSWYLHLCYNM